MEPERKSKLFALTLTIPFILVVGKLSRHYPILFWPVSNWRAAIGIPTLGVIITLFFWYVMKNIGNKIFINSVKLEL